MATEPTDKAVSTVAARPAPGAVISHDALERVLARAMELQLSAEAGLDDGISEARLVEIANEVGIDVTNLKQAIAEERARIPLAEPERGAVLDALGTGEVSGQRTVPGSPAVVLQRLESWMPRMEQLALQRRVGERVSWEPRRDALGKFLSGLGMGGRGAELARADMVAAMATPVDDQRSVVRLEAQLHGVRRTQRNIFAVLSIVLVKVFLLLSIPIWFIVPGVAAPVLTTILALFFGGTGFMFWRTLRRSYRRMTARVQLRLEQILDELEGGNLSARPAAGLLGHVRDALLGP